ncbi:hypothetical protein ACQP2U_35280 [Nocardia sp. CA-084685]|uniref:hypothetical protein n=1 Tax=Nocardia sp. CA-084685 TaxID=3239970 RepID=UPI003D965062
MSQGAIGERFSVFRDDNDRDPINWGRSAIILVLVLGIAVVLMLMVVTADFGDKSPATTVPKTPGACAPFCPSKSQ